MRMAELAQRLHVRILVLGIPGTQFGSRPSRDFVEEARRDVI